MSDYHQFRRRRRPHRHLTVHQIFFFLRLVCPPDLLLGGLLGYLQGPPRPKYNCETCEQVGPTSSLPIIFFSAFQIKKQQSLKKKIKKQQVFLKNKKIKVAGRRPSAAAAAMLQTASLFDQSIAILFSGDPTQGQQRRLNSDPSTASTSSYE